MDELEAIELEEMGDAPSLLWMPHSVLAEPAAAPRQATQPARGRAPSGRGAPSPLLRPWKRPLRSPPYWNHFSRGTGSVECTSPTEGNPSSWSGWRATQ